MSSGWMVEGRTCGKCSLCCKLVFIPELNKPDNVWCEHCEIGKGCRIYEQRPQVCREFYCLYMKDAGLDERWNPAVAHFFLRIQDECLIVQIDPQRPDAWKREPYHSALRRRAGIVYSNGRTMMAKIGERSIMILPDRDVDLGVLSKDERVTAMPTHTSSGVRWEVYRQQKPTPPPLNALRQH